MSYAYRYIRNRYVFALIMLVLSVLFALWYFPQGEPERRLITGAVVEVNHGATTSVRTGQPANLVTVKVALDDGSVVRVMVMGREPRVGERVSLQELTYPDGERRYQLPAID
ncbi:MAG: hypothetical protein ACK4SX_01215 [Alcanivoracaceae bacterium]